jgi:hypothetical protein
MNQIFRWLRLKKSSTIAYRVSLSANREQQGDYVLDIFEGML